MRLAVQKAGRLTDESMQLLRHCGLDLAAPHSRLILPARNMDVELLLLRDDDIGDYVRSGVADAGLLGENVVREQGNTELIVRRLGYATCRLAIAVPRDVPYEGVACLAGKRIATSYPAILADFLARHGVEADIHEISGSVEIAPGIGLADAICDMVSSGSTLLSNGLRDVTTVMESEAVLIVRPGMSASRMEALNRLIFRIDAVLAARHMRYILMNAPSEAVPAIAAILPVLQSPTVMPLARAGWCSVHSVIPADRAWELIDQVHMLGAEGILVTSIESMVA